MRPLVTTFVTLIGVMQAPGGPGEDPSGGFSHEGWLPRFFDDGPGEQMNAWFVPAQDFLLGRTTYDIFYGSWPQMISDDVKKKIGATGAILGTHALPVWLGYLSGVNAVVLLLGVGVVFESDEETWLVGIGGFGGFLLFLIWTLATSIVLPMRSRRHAGATA